MNFSLIWSGGGGGITIPNIARLEHFQNQIKVLEKTYNEAPDHLPLATKKPRQSKRRMGNSLPNDWRDQLADRLPNWRMQYFFAMSTGCRPSELLKGVTLTIQAGSLVAHIKGAKIGPTSGQPERTLQWSVKNLPEGTRYLAQEVARAGGQLVVDLTTGSCNNNPKQAFSDAIKAAAKRIWPNRKLSITAYSLRHAAASDLKATDFSPAEISAALGHAAIATKSTYGRASGARGNSVAPEKVQATKPVRGQPSRWESSEPERHPRERG